MDTSKIVGEKIKALREDKSISIEELAQRSGLAIEQIERIENNIDIPSLAPLIKIARVLGVRLGTFLDDQDEIGPVVCRKKEAKDAISFSNNAIHSRKHMEYHSLSKSKADRHMEPFIIDVMPTEDSDFVLSSHEGEEFIITGYSDSQITAVGQTHGKEMILTPVSTAALQQAKERKRLAIIAYNKAQAMDLLKGELNNGVFRRSSSSFLAHYLIICDESNNWKVKISAIDNGVVKHTEYPMIIDTTNDENAVLTLGSNVTVDGISLNKLYYNYLNGEIETDNANVVCDTRKASDIAAWYADGWKTHIVDQDEIHADFKGIFHSGVEFDDRNPRNLIACPWSGMGSYIGFAVTMTADNATGRIFISLGEPYDLFGWNNNPADYNRVQQDYSKFLSFCVSEDGFYWSYDDNDSMVYVLSATGERWFRMKK